MSKLNPTPKLNDPSLDPTWFHHVWVVTGCTTVLFSLANAAIYGSTDSHTLVKTILAGFIGYLFVDLFSGFYHWVFDNYGDFSFPILGSHINTFRRHHELPWAAGKRQFSSNLHVAARIITHVVPPMNFMWHDQPAVMGFVGMFSGGVLFAVQIHGWAHMSKSKVPPMVVALQDAGVLLAQPQHAIHHRSGDRTYCIVSGVWNRVLDEYKVFEGLEKAVFFVLGVEPRSWNEANSVGMATKAYFETSPDP